MSLWCDPVQNSIGSFPQTVPALRVLVQEPLKQPSFPRAGQQDMGPGREMLVEVAEHDVLVAVSAVGLSDSPCNGHKTSSP